MRVRIRLTTPLLSPPERVVLDRRVLLRRVLLCAREAAFYRPIGHPPPMGEAGETPESILQRWPRVECAQRTRCSQLFFNARAPEPWPTRFYSPVHPAPRTAVFLGGVMEGGTIRVFREDQAHFLAHY